jgi:hypothetical protein
MFDTAAGSHLTRPYRPAVLVAQAILPDFHVCTQDDSVAKPPVETTQEHNSAREENISGSSAFEFSTAKSADTSTDQCSFDLLVYLIKTGIASSATMDVRRNSSGYSQEAERERGSSTSNHKPVI